MKFFKKIAQTSALSRKQEQYLYALVLKEVENNKKLAGLWSMALSRSGGDTSRAQSLYISLRVQDIKDDLILLEGIGDSRSEEDVTLSVGEKVAKVEDCSGDGAVSSKSNSQTGTPIAKAGVITSSDVVLESSYDGPSIFDEEMAELKDISNTLRKHLK